MGHQVPNQSKRKGNKMQMLSFKQTAQLIKAVGHNQTIIVEGENGIGKTGLFHQLKDDPFFAGHTHVDPIDCTQLSDGSVWMPDIDRDMGVSRELPNERFGVHKENQKGINGSRPALVFLDEIAKARQYIKDVLAPIVYELECCFSSHAIFLVKLIALLLEGPIGRGLDFNLVYFL